MLDTPKLSEKQFIIKQIMQFRKLSFSFILMIQHVDETIRLEKAAQLIITRGVQKTDWTKEATRTEVKPVVLSCMVQSVVFKV